MHSRACSNQFYYIFTCELFLSTGIVNFNHVNGCQQCLSQGEYSTEFHRMSFPEINKTNRTNEMFRARMQKGHHKDNSLLEKLNIDMIASFPTSDPLHLLDLGVMKRCLTRWVYGMKGYSRKWNKHTVENVSSILKKNEWPNGFRYASCN